jgi:ubiquinone/menaquinone biosynthesis C-methylase UbiE
MSPTPAQTSENIAGNYYDKYSSTHPIERRMMKGFFDALDRALDGLAPKVIVEVGAGEGRMTERLRKTFPEASVIGLDIAVDRLASQWSDLERPMLFGDGRCLPIATRSVDLVIALESLEHVTDPLPALVEMSRICRGHAVFSVPREPIWRIGNIARGRYVRELGNTPGHINHWSTWTFRRYVSRSFEVSSVSKPLPWTLVRARPNRSAVA